MSIHRMFSRRITDKASFLRLDATARLLYYDLGMKADDDGFVEAFTVMRTTGASEADLRALEARGFVKVVNDDLLSWITDWGENNRIRRDRYRPGIYHGLLKQLTGKCHPDDNQPGAACQPDDDPPEDIWEPQDKTIQDKTIQDNTRQDTWGFSPPAPEEVRDYAAEMGYAGFNAETFVNYYAANGWKVGRNPMKDWRAAVRSWHTRDKPPIPAMAIQKEYGEFNPLTDW